MPSTLRYGYLFGKWVSQPSFSPTQFLDMPNELLLQVAESLGPRDLDCLLRTNHFLKELLSPVLLKLAVTSYVSAKRRSVLHWASAHNRGSLMKLLLERGVQDDVNWRGDDGMTAIHSAAIAGHETPVKLLLENGANIEVKNSYGWTPLMFAIVMGNPTITRILLENGADIESTRYSPYLKSSLHNAAALGHMGVVDVLIEMGCDTRAVDAYGMNAVQNAASFGQEEMVERLLGLGGFDTDLSVDPYLSAHSVSTIDYNQTICKMILAFENDLCRVCLPVSC